MFGYGAFLVYLGALKLNGTEKARRDRMMSKREYYFPQTTRLLDVRDVDGWEKTLRLAGENLHGNHNNCYWPKHMIPRKAVWKTTERIHTCLLSLTGRSCYMDDDDERDAEYVEAKLQTMKSRGLEPIGHLGIYSIEDYSPAPGISFKLDKNVIDLGRYGPWRNQGNYFHHCSLLLLPFHCTHYLTLFADRKPRSALDIKAFLFQNQPNRYTMGTEQSLDGEEQIIDVSDDVTGLPHDIAKANIPMYINEVGYDLTRKQTVFCVVSNNGRNANYSVAFYDGLSLSNGSKVELLVNYFKGYEETREIEGYGLKNLYSNLPDGKSLARRIQSGVKERVYMLDTILETGVMEEKDIPEEYRGSGLSAVEVAEKMMRLSALQFSNSIERVDAITHKPVLSKIGAFRATGDASLVSSLQIVANRRIGWLGGVFLNALPKLKTGWDRAVEEGRVDETSAYARAVSYNQAKEVLLGWKTDNWLLTDGRSDPRVPQGGDESINEILRKETQEDVCFELRDQLVEAFDKSVWCPVACDLIGQLIDVVHFSDFSPWAEAEEISETSRSDVMKQFGEAVTNAFTRVEDAIMKGSTENLRFSSGLTEDHVVRGSISDIFGSYGSRDTFYLGHSAIPKGFTSEVARRLAYIDSVGPSCINGVKQQSDGTLGQDDNFVMVRTDKLTAESAAWTQIAGIPQMAVDKELGGINREWYLLWQVAFPALAFVMRYIPGHKESMKSSISNDMNLDKEWIDFALEKGIQRIPHSFWNVCVPKKEIIFKEVDALAFHMSHPRQEADDETRKRRRKGALDRLSARKARRLHIEEKYGGKRPVGSGRAGVTEEQMLLSQEDLKKADKRKKTSGTAIGGRPVAKLVWSGEPDETFYPWNKEPINWPPGWKKQVFQRASGGTIGASDRYWYTPLEDRKLRSLREVARFFDCMEACGQDETQAWKRFKRGR